MPAGRTPLQSGRVNQYFVGAALLLHTIPPLQFTVSPSLSNFVHLASFLNTYMAVRGSENPKGHVVMWWAWYASLVEIGLTENWGGQVPPPPAPLPPVPTTMHYVCTLTYTLKSPPPLAHFRLYFGRLRGGWKLGRECVCYVCQGLNKHTLHMHIELERGASIHEIFSFVCKRCHLTTLLCHLICNFICLKKVPFDNFVLSSSKGQ